jgi:hypothetical protein
MKTPKNRSMPLTTAMARFVDVAELIRSRAELDDTLRDLCEDYRLARELLLNAKKEKPRSTKNISEYSSLVDDLEDEIMRYLVNVKQHPET